MPECDFYGGKDPRELPLYGIGEAAHHLHMAPATLRSWAVGRSYPTQEGPGFFDPLIRIADPDGNRLSFHNLVEAHVLRALRTRHGVPVKAVRSALSYAEDELGIDRLLLSDELRTSAGDVFLERYGELITLSRSGQIAIKRLLEAYLERVDRDAGDFPLRLYPFLVHDIRNGSRPIVIDPRISFGRPTITGAGISTAAIAGRVDAGESVEDLADDYGLSEEQIEEALIYERAA